MIVATVADRSSQHPWLRVERLIRAVVVHRWSPEEWMTVKLGLRRALELRQQIRRAGWFN